MGCVYHRGWGGARPEAAEIRIYAERRAGELLSVMKRSKELAGQGGDRVKWAHGDDLR